jgi:hypothetical protein
MAVPVEDPVAANGKFTGAPVPVADKRPQPVPLTDVHELAATSKSMERPGTLRGVSGCSVG